MPDLAFLIGPEYAGMHAKANGIMSAFVEQTKAQKAASGADDGNDALAEKMWQGTKECTVARQRDAADRERAYTPTKSRPWP